MPPQMEYAMETMMFTFHKFAGDKGYLTKEDLRVLMEKEFPGFLENQKDLCRQIMKDLTSAEMAKWASQSFFFSLIMASTIACNDYFVVHMKQKGKKQAETQFPSSCKSCPKGSLRNLPHSFPIEGFHEQIRTLSKCKNKI
nr:protein S100-A10-like [Chlorocebus sabaeus]